MERMRLTPLVFAALAGSVSLAAAPARVKPIPAAGIVLPEAEHAALQAELDHLESDIQALSGRPGFRQAEPDLEVFHKAVAWSLADGTFYSEKQVAYAQSLVREGEGRAQAFSQGGTPWLRASGTVLRGYRSTVDDSIQPFALTVPEEVAAAPQALHPALVWLLGRGEERTEVGFFQEQATKPAAMAPKGTIVIHPYGRFCNATKFAGETDVFEALAATQGTYAIDKSRIALGGFSMGGASVWHLAVHGSGTWCVATPGAGFADTPIYTRALEPGKPARYPWEVSLWREYDAIDCAANLSNLRTIAYSGEIDAQKQSADLMEKAMAADGLTLERLIGPKTGHKYEPQTKKILDARIDEAIARGRDPMPADAWLTTYTLRYPSASWLTAEALTHHWQKAQVRAHVASAGTAVVTTDNVEAFAIRRGGIGQLTIDGQAVSLDPGSDLSFVRKDGRWTQGAEPAGARRKAPGLTGPIDDAFRSRFVFVLPTGHSSPQVDAWVASEVAHAKELWHRVFRGEVLCVKDTDVSDADLRFTHAVLWGDAASNRVIARYAARLPVQWSGGRLSVAGRSYDAATHVPILIYPNPEAPSSYVVLNSGVDFRDEAYGTNALQTAKLPDWAVIDLSVPPNGRWPGGISDAGFFDEAWSHPVSDLPAN